MGRPWVGGGASGGVGGGQAIGKGASFGRRGARGTRGGWSGALQVKVGADDRDG